MSNAPEQSIPVFRTKSHVPDTVIQTARNPLSNQIASFLGLYKVLIAVHVCDIPEGLPFNFITRSTLAESGGDTTLHILFNLR